MTQNEASTRGRHEVLTIQDGEDVAQNEASTRGRYEVLTIQDGEDVAQNEASTRGGMSYLPSRMERMWPRIRPPPGEV